MSLRIVIVLPALALLAACSASTQLVTNDKASDAVKAKSFKSYREVLLIPPNDDPRHVVPRVAFSPCRPSTTRRRRRCSSPARAETTW